MANCDSLTLIDGFISKDVVLRVDGVVGVHPWPHNPQPSIVHTFLFLFLEVSRQRSFLDIGETSVQHVYAAIMFITS